jgi:hypothetical protein
MTNIDPETTRRRTAQRVAERRVYEYYGSSFVPPIVDDPCFAWDADRWDEKVWCA